MSVDLEREAPVRAHRPLEEEREIDFARLGRSILSRWWLVLAAVLLGAVLGYLTALGGSDVYVARTTVYLGTPLSPGGGSPIQSAATNPATVNEVVRSEAVVQDVAAEVGVPPGELRGAIATRPIAAATAAARGGQSPLVEISVRGPWREASAQAANLLAERLIEAPAVAEYVTVKSEALRAQVENQNRELDEIQTRLDRLEQAALQPGLSDVERLSLQSLIGFAEQRRGQLVNERTTTRQLLTLAETVEQSSQLTEARAAPVPAQSPRAAIVVGALIGLLVGLALALLWEPLVGRRRGPRTA